MQLIENWKQALSMTSVQAGGAIAALGVAEQQLPSLQEVLPPIAYGVLGLLVMIVRVVLQPKLTKYVVGYGVHWMCGPARVDQEVEQGGV